MRGLCLSYITFWTTLAPHVLFLQTLLEILFKVLFANSQRWMNKILQSIFKIWNFLPLFQMLFFWLNKTPPKWDLPLSVQEGFDLSFLKYYFLPLLNTIGYQLKIFNTKFLKLVVVRSFCFGLISPPFWHESPKTESLEPLKCYLPLWA